MIREPSSAMLQAQAAQNGHLVPMFTVARVQLIFGNSHQAQMEDQG